MWKGTRWLLLLLFVLSSASTALAQRNVPVLTGRVMDRAEILTPTTERTLTALLEAHEDSTSNQLAILTIDRKSVV